MKTLILLMVTAFVLTSFVHAQADQSRLQLSEGTKIFVGELGRTDAADIVREKIKLRLIETNKFAVVDRQDDADAILTGTVIVERFIEDDSTQTKAVAVFYLRGAKTNEVLWTYEYKPKSFDFKHLFTDEATRGYNKVANRTVDRMLKDAGLQVK